MPRTVNLILIAQQVRKMGDRQGSDLFPPMRPTMGPPPPLGLCAPPGASLLTLRALGDLIDHVRVQLPPERQKDHDLDSKCAFVFCSLSKDMENALMATAAMSRCKELELRVAELEAQLAKQHAPQPPVERAFQDPAVLAASPAGDAIFMPYPTASVCPPLQSSSSNSSGVSDMGRKRSALEAKLSRVPSGVELEALCREASSGEASSEINSEVTEGRVGASSSLSSNSSS